MKRDIELIRKILFAIEKFPSPIMGTGLCIDGYSSDEINYHIMILDEAGLILANNASHGNNCIWFPIRLTWNGHDFLEVAREDKNWMKAKEIT